MSVNPRMSFLDQMKLPGLIDLSLIVILASSSKGQSWNVTLRRRIATMPGLDVTIPCRFTVPLKHQTENVQVYWKKRVRSSFNTFDNDQNAFISHPNGTFVLEKYRGRTQLIGNTAKGECDLKILKIMDNEPNIYVRVIAKGNNYSFVNDFVQISVSDAAAGSFKPDIIAQPLPTFETTTNVVFATVDTTQETSAPPTMYMAIFVPVAALLIIILVVGLVFCKKHKRSQSFTREESGYYANFRRTSSNQAKREASCEKQDNKKLSEVKAIDEPVYMNTEAPPGQMDHSMDHTENIYANVDYTK